MNFRLHLVARLIPLLLPGTGQMFDGIFADCYGPYSDANENKGSFGLGSGTAWEWSSAASLGGTSFNGVIDTYGGGGFHADLPRYRSALTSRIHVDSTSFFGGSHVDSTWKRPRFDYYHVLLGELHCIPKLRYHTEKKSLVVAIKN